MISRDIAVSLPHHWEELGKLRGSYQVNNKIIARWVIDGPYIFESFSKKATYTIHYRDQHILPYLYSTLFQSDTHRPKICPMIKK